MPICEICHKPMSLQDRLQFEDNGAPPGEWPCCHDDCADLELHELPSEPLKKIIPSST